MLVILEKSRWQIGETSGEMNSHMVLLITLFGRAVGFNNQHILDTFKLGLPSNVYINLVYIDGRPATLNMANRPVAVSKGG